MFFRFDYQLLWEQQDQQAYIHFPQILTQTELLPYIINQSRICGKGVGLSFFPSHSLSFESYEQFVRKSKKSKNDCFCGHFWAKFGYVSHIPAIRI